MEQNLQIKTITETDFVGSVSHTIYKGRAVFEIGNIGYSSDIEIYTAASGAYIKYNLDSNLSLSFEDIQFSGSLDDGTFIKGSVIGSAGLCISECNELQIGEFDKIQSIETILLGCYFQHKFSLDYKVYHIQFLPSITSPDVAKRTYRLNQTLLEGNPVVITCENLNIDDVNNLFREICRFLRPLVASEVYFGRLMINQKSMIYHRLKMKGNLFGMKNNVLESTIQYSEYLKSGLEKWENLSEFDKVTIIDVGHALATSNGCGLLETGLLVLVVALERLSKNEMNAHFRISIDNYLKINGWTQEHDIEAIKDLRNSLAHSGVLPENFDKEKAKLIQVQLEYFLLIAVLDKLDFKGRISASKDGWRIFPMVEDVKVGNME